MDKYRDPELVELVDELLSSIDPVTQRDYLYNLITYKNIGSKTVKEALQAELKSMKQLDIDLTKSPLPQIDEEATRKANASGCDCIIYKQSTEERGEQDE